jgi:hypothetical protein
MPFSSDPGVCNIGHLILDLPSETMAVRHKARWVDVVMKFGGTVFSVTAKCRNSGKVVSANFKFPLGEGT